MAVGVEESLRQAAKYLLPSQLDEFGQQEEHSEHSRITEDGPAAVESDKRAFEVPENIEDADVDLTSQYQSICIARACLPHRPPR